MQTTPAPTTRQARSTDSFELAMAIKPTIPKAYHGVTQDGDGRFVQLEFEQTMHLLGLRGQISDRIQNMRDAEGEMIVLQGDIEDLQAQATGEKQRSKGGALRIQGNLLRRMARVAYLRERIERWGLELQALKALLNGAI